MGCSSTSHPGLVTTKAPPEKITVSCGSDVTVPEGYPWSIRGHHIVTNVNTPPYGIVQSQKSHTQFTLCKDCPCPTTKHLQKTKHDKSNKNTSRNLRKLVINFASASHQLSEIQQKIIQRFYASLPDQYTLTVTGYTDDTSSGGYITNEALAQHRAQVVLDYLISLGMNNESATTRATPLCCYIAPNDSDAGRALNRRAEIIVTPVLSPPSAINQ